MASHFRIIAQPKTSHLMGGVLKPIAYTKASRPLDLTCKRLGNTNQVEIRYLTLSEWVDYSKFTP